MNGLVAAIAEFACFGAMIGSLLYLTEMKPLFIRLRDKHPALWQELGMPEIPPGVEQPQMDEMIKSAFGMPVVTYLLNKRYADSGDADLAAQCDKPRRHLLLVTCCLGVLLATLIPSMASDILHGRF